MSESLGVSAIIDTHVHLDDPAFADDVDAVLEASRAVGVFRVINIGYSPASWQTSRMLRDRHRDVEIVLGVHPQLAESYDRRVARDLRDALADMQPLAIGEIGFDFYRDRASLQAQARAFRSQLDLAAEFGLPVVIHQRSAGAELISSLDEWSSQLTLILHSFDGTPELAHWAVDRRCYIGIGGLATKSGSASLRDILRSIPVDRLLLETDSPYLAPPGSGSRRNTPAQLPRIATLLAPLWDLSVEELCRITTANATQAFRIASPHEDDRNDAERTGPSIDRNVKPGETRGVSGATAADH